MVQSGFEILKITNIYQLITVLTTPTVESIFDIHPKMQQNGGALLSLSRIVKYFSKIPKEIKHRTQNYNPTSSKNLDDQRKNPCKEDSMHLQSRFP